MTSPLAFEKVWFEKSKYDEAERQYFEKLSKIPTPVSQDSVAPQSQGKDEKRLKPKEAKEKKNKADKKGHDKNSSKEDSKGASNTPLKHSLAGEVAKVRQHIQNSLECMDGIAALATNVNVEIVNRLNAVEKKNQDLGALVSDLQSVIKQLESRVQSLELQNKGKTAPVPSKPAPTKAAPAKAAPAPKKPEKKEDDDDVDLFGSDADDDAEAVKKIKEDVAASKKKSKKEELIQKSIIILDVKPWDDETDMKIMEESVRKISTDGLLWGASKLVPLAYGIHKLQISCVVEDEKVSIDWLQETIESLEDYVQSVDIAAFNKV